MKCIKTYSFASTTVRLVSDCPVEDTEYYSRFLTDKTPDVTVNIFCGKLPQINGEFIAKSEKKTVIKNDSGFFVYTSYYNQKKPGFVTYACKAEHENIIDLYIDFAGGLWDKMIFNALDIPQIMVNFGSLLIHCSVVEYKGKGIMFAGDSGAGKSTQASLWKQYRGAEIINGDRGAICADGGGFNVYGVPFNGTSAICQNKSCKAELLVLIGRGEKNEFFKLDGASAFRMLLGKTTYYEWDRQSVESVLDILDRFVKAVPVFCLKCLPDESAVRTLEEGYEQYLSEKQ